ncbi:MAG TPA: family 43 glycosylhydrolase [Clostridiales bacterium]|nr:family 43 glycosylhydrolase [Clostridiales bacterium]
MKYFCNPLNIEYKYQFHQKEGQGGFVINREAADPSLVLFHDLYYLFPSMTAGFLTSKDLVSWEFHKFRNEMPIYDYAPDVRVIGDYLYFSASKRMSNCHFYRTKDPINDTFELIEGSFPFWDPNLFCDEDGRIYFYWGCSNMTPIYGVELDPASFKPKTEPLVMFGSREQEYGYERNGEDHVPPKTPEQIEATVQAMIKRNPGMPEEQKQMMYKYMGNDPYIEGAWMTKHNGKYYLQYAIPGTQYNVYCDGVYVSDAPLGPFHLAKNNPFSYKPGGFFPGAGHGSTVEDRSGMLWHTATMRISINHNFERRLGLWQAGFDQDGELFCDQRYGDWPLSVEQKPWDKPEWMLLSYGREVTASSGTGMEHVTDENVQTWWKAAESRPGEWVQLDLGKAYDVRGIQINFADDQIQAELPEGAELQGEMHDRRYIDQGNHVTRWILEGSVDGKEYFVIEDKSEAMTDLSHDFIVREDGLQARYIKLTVKELPFNQIPCISGLRVFGKTEGELPGKPENVAVEILSPLDIQVQWEKADATGYNVLWGHSPDKLYHSYMVFGRTSQKIGALMKEEPLYIRVDSFNEVGITEGGTIKVF